MALALFAAGLMLPARAVEYNYNTGTYVATPPDDTASGYSVSGWDSGWNGPQTGWSYEGQVNGDSAIYLGNGFVLTAGHVGTSYASAFSLGSSSYAIVPGSIVEIQNNAVDTAIDPTLAGTTADLTLFQISNAPSLAPLTLALDSPTAFNTPGDRAGSAVVMIGYGGSLGETWGENNVTEINQTTPLFSYESLDFDTDLGTQSTTHHDHTTTITNNAQLVGGDSGGGDFIYNSATGKWELAGINEAQLGYYNSDDVFVVQGSAMIQLSDYDAQIEADMAEAVPEPSYWLPLSLALAALCGCARRRPAGKIVATSSAF